MESNNRYALGNQAPRRIPIVNMDELEQALREQAEIDARDAGRKPETPPAPNNRDDSNSQTQIQIKANIVPREYLQVGINGLYGQPVVISCYELQRSNSKNYEDANRFVLSQGLYVPTPLIFTTHFKNVIEAKKDKKGKKPLLYADGTPVDSKETDEIYQHLTTDFKDVFGTNNPGAWAWLNAQFVEGNEHEGLDLETIVEIKSDGTFITRKEPLAKCLEEDCFATLDFNSQGLAITKSASHSYSQGNNLKFYQPTQGQVAWFFADSDGTNLNCCGNPTYAAASLGVFTCAEGTAAQKITNGGKI